MACQRCEKLEAALRELIKTADPALNMSDIPLLDALSLARSSLEDKLVSDPEIDKGQRELWAPWEV